MSLLNDALRAAEERQNRPDVASAYTGNTATEARGLRVGWLVLLVVLALGIAALGGYWIINSPAGSSVEAPVPEKAESVQASNAGAVQRSRSENVVATVQGPAEPVPPAEEPVETAEPTAPAPPSPAEPAEEISVAERAEAREVAQSEAEPEASASPESEVMPAPEHKELASGPSAEQPRVTTPPPAADPAPVVKRKARTPEAVDRQTAEELSALIRQGRISSAEALLSDLTDQQSAVRSRFVVARALLVEGEVNRALRWLPDSVAATDANLRMLRARALHAGGDLDRAVATLQAQVPPVADHVEYRVTLATLLQQQGEGQEAARHWAELIAWDDSRAPWWVGLAIALEDQGEVRGATRAYEQAAALPGLPPSLADYVQQRLRSLRAG